NQFAQVLEKLNVVRDGVAIRQHPIGVVEIKVDQAGHVVPAAQVQSDDVIAEVVGKLLHLKRQGMRFNQRHALDVVVRQDAPLRESLEQIAPPQRFLSRF